MAYVEVTKGGEVVGREPLPDETARRGCQVRLGGLGAVRLKLGESAVVEDYEVRVVAGAAGPSDSSQVGPAGAEGAAAQDAHLRPDGSLRVPPISVGPTGAAAAEPAEGQPFIEGYDIVEEIGRGGMGTVWRAVQLSTGRQVALKVMAAEAGVSEAARRRFEREVRLAARLEHPNIARVHDSGLLHGGYYYAMELVDGQALDEHVRRQGLSTREILKLMRTVCEAASFAHQGGIIHRDLKPSNILVTRDGQPHILDFGLARSIDGDAGLTTSVEAPAAGTPAYMAPEQAAGRTRHIGPWTDVYALGVIAFELLTGRSLHDLSGDGLGLTWRIVERNVPRPADVCAAIDEQLEAVLLRALAFHPAERHADAGALGRDIAGYLAGRPIARRGPAPAHALAKWGRRHGRALAAAAMSVLAVGAVTAIVWHARPAPQAAPEAAAAQASGAAGELTLGLGGVEMKLVLVPAGTFRMGSPAAEVGRYDDEGPRHEVTIEKAFYMGATEVTQAQWLAVTGSGPWAGKPYVREGREHAASWISWGAAADFCRRLSDRTGLAVRLPTEAEWEYACRAGGSTRFCYGDDPQAEGLGNRAWCYENAWGAGERYTHPVGRKEPNAWGLFDMHGNVLEWCSDWYDPAPYGRAGAAGGQPPRSGDFRVHRGGAWNSHPRLCRSAYRAGNGPEVQAFLLGVRVAADLPGGARAGRAR